MSNIIVKELLRVLDHNTVIVVDRDTGELYYCDNPELPACIPMRRVKWCEPRNGLAGEPILLVYTF